MMKSHPLCVDRIDNLASQDHISADAELLMLGGLHISPPPPLHPAHSDSLLEGEGGSNVDLDGLSGLRVVANTLGPTGILIAVLLLLGCW